MTPIDAGLLEGAPRAVDEGPTVARRSSLRDSARALVRRVFVPVDAAWLSVFRAMFGVLLGVSMQRFLAYGWVDELLVSPSFRFHYWGFSWVEPLSRSHMHALFWALSALGIAVAVGFAYRVTAPLFALGLTYVQLLDVSTYLNHYYLAGLLAWLLAFSPAGRAHSVDALIVRKFAAVRASRGAASEASPASRPNVARGWLWLFRLQIAIVYACAALAKLQPDWLLHGQPLGIWLGARTSVPVLGKIFTWPHVPLAMSWAGFLFDATIVFFLSRPRTRKGAFVVVVVFHALTRVLFDIGMFPFIMTCAVTVFFSASWPRDVLARVRRSLGREAAESVRSDDVHLEPRVTAPEPTTWGQRLVLVAFALYALAQVLVPLRAFAYGGNVLWHEQGMRFSWRVMVRAKGGSTTFFVKNPRTGKLYLVSPRAYLTPYQENEMASQPDLVLQLAKRIAEDYSLREGAPVEVRAEVLASLNARPGALLIDPEVDLSTVGDGIGNASWILPAPTEPPPPIRPVL